MFQRKLNTSDTLVVASHNSGKVIEIKDLLKQFDLKVVSAAELDLPEPKETGHTFAENANLKSLAAAKAADLPALADDSGLEVTALDGAPGIYSARWAGPTKDFAIAMENVRQALDDKGVSAKSKPKANFICALSLAWPDGHHQIFEGKVFGHLTWPARGSKGFGYDPIFIADGYDITFGEMDPEHKHSISHRARAFELFVKECFE